MSRRRAWIRCLASPGHQELTVGSPSEMLTTLMLYARGILQHPLHARVEIRRSRSRHFARIREVPDFDELRARRGADFRVGGDGDAGSMGTMAVARRLRIGIGGGGGRRQRKEPRPPG